MDEQALENYTAVFNKARTKPIIPFGHWACVKLSGAQFCSINVSQKTGRAGTNERQKVGCTEFKRSVINAADRKHTNVSCAHRHTDVSNAHVINNKLVF